VLDLEPGSVAPAPRIGTKLRTEFIRGMGKQNERFIIILDIDKVFSCDELAQVGWLEGESRSRNIPGNCS
jgi:purine-binding chemotaxis protein CheW